MLRRYVRIRSIQRFFTLSALIGSIVPLAPVACGGEGATSGGGPAIAQGGTSTNPGSGGTQQQQQGGAVGNGGNVTGQGGTNTGGTATSTSSNGGATTGGAASSGGASDVGGAKATGGASNVGGAKATGGASNVGGAKATGGASSVGGAKATGGASSVGGAKATGGSTSGGATTGGAKATGGAQAAGGASTGGAKATGGAMTATGGTTTATGGATSSGACKFPSSHTNNGSLTWYTLSQGTALVNCSFPTNQSGETVSYVANNGTYFAAMNTAEYNTAATCGACIQVTRDNGKTVTVTIADQCPVGSNSKCTSGHVDLAKPAFLQLGTESEGYLGTGNGGAVGIISWKYVPCAVTGNVHVLLKEPSNAGWNQFLVANHRTPVAKFEALINGSWVTGTRQTYNYFDVGSSLSFPLSVRITDTNGAIITGTVKSGTADQDIGSQFPTCTQ